MKFSLTDKCIVLSLPLLLIGFLYFLAFPVPKFDPNLPEKVIPKFTDAQRINFRLKQQKSMNYDNVDLPVSAFKNETWVSMARKKGVLKKGSIKNNKLQIINWSD